MATNVGVGGPDGSPQPELAEHFDAGVLRGRRERIAAPGFRVRICPADVGDRAGGLVQRGPGPTRDRRSAAAAMSGPPAAR